MVPSEKNSSKPPHRWNARPGLSTLLRVLAVVVPVAASIGASAVVAHVLPPPETGWEVASWWGVYIATSILVLLGVDRLARRMLPLAALLRLSILFPDRAPSRLQVARRAGRVRDLRKRLHEAREHGLDDELTRAAEIVLALVAALSAHDRLTRGHSERVRAYVDLLADELRLPVRDRDLLRWAALLHDIGKMAVDAEILNKPGVPDETQWEAIHRHPVEGARLAGPLMPWLGPWGPTIEQHHEHFDGTGYPHGLAGQDISLGARIVAVADSYDTMTAGRPYRRPLSPEAARKELATGAGTHFDPTLVRAFLNLSIGHLSRRIGLVTWLAALPVLPRRAAFALQRAGAQAVAGTAAAATVVSLGVGWSAPPPPAAPAPQAQVRAARLVPPSPEALPTEESLATETAMESPNTTESALPRAGRSIAAAPIATASPLPSPTPSPAPTSSPQPSPIAGTAAQSDLRHGECVSQTARADPQGSGTGERVPPVAKNREGCGASQP
ncbi:MAG: HD-GYP domain-containing protein [Actinomycetota bacterium]